MTADDSAECDSWPAGPEYNVMFLDTQGALATCRRGGDGPPDYIFYEQADTLSAGEF